jgi:hypothetical protein
VFHLYKYTFSLNINDTGRLATLYRGHGTERCISISSIFMNCYRVMSLALPFVTLHAGFWNSVSVFSSEAFPLCLWLNHNVELLLRDLSVYAVIDNSVEAM